MSQLDRPAAVILVINPDPLLLTGIAAVLDMQGYECHCARDAEAARKAACRLPLDLIICEINIPGTNGIELCQQLAVAGDLQDVPVIYLCSSEQAAAINDASKLTFVLRRPFEPQALIDEVASALWLPHLVNTRVRQKSVNEESQSVIPAPAGARRASSTERRQRT